VSVYARAYGKIQELKFERDELLYLGRIARISKNETTRRLKPLVGEIKDTAAKHNVDPYLLTAILIDELARMGPDDLLDVLGKLDIVDTSVGLAQVKMSTARDMIKKKYYDADPNISPAQLYELLIDDRESIQFAAAYINFIKNFRVKKNVGISAAELSSCYSQGLAGKANVRGKQIATRLRKLAKEILD
jgi:hypothetical protein